MKNKLILAIVVLGTIFATSCSKETIINNYQIVSVNFNPSEFIVKSVTPFMAKLASVSRPEAQAFEFTAMKPEKYFAYFIVGNEVIHRFDNIVEGNQSINVYKRKYDIIIVSSVELSNDALRAYNSEQEHKGKLLYALPETSDKLVLAGAIYDTDIYQNTSVTVTVYNSHAAVVFFNTDYTKTQNDVDFISAEKNGVEYQYLFVKDRNALDFDHTFTAGFKFEAGGPLVNITEQITSNKVYKYFINRGYVEGNFDVVVAPLLTETFYKEINGQ